MHFSLTAAGGLKPTSLRLTHARKRLPPRIGRFRMQARQQVGVEEWMEENLDVGKIVGSRFNGSSQWSSQYELQSDSGDKYFVKTDSRSSDAMFKGESLGLRAMYDTGAFRIPKVLHYGPHPSGKGSFIVMDFLNFSSGASDEAFGTALAQMHLAKPKDEMAAKGNFGFPVDNTIGGTSQPNGWMDNWVDFFRERRLNHQLKLAGDSRLSQMGKELANNLEIFFEDAQVTPSLLHGDLWSGNIASVEGEPSIFDPAVYYGHHEAEFGMSWCAGFSASFWKAYHKLIPRAPGFDQRKQIYTLYHYLNHYNLFGSGYYGQCEMILSSLTRDL